MAGPHYINGTHFFGGIKFPANVWSSWRVSLIIVHQICVGSTMTPVGGFDSTSTTWEVVSFVSRIRFTPAKIFHDHKLRMQLQPFHKLCGALLGFGVLISLGWIFFESCRSRGVKAILLVYTNLCFGSHSYKTSGHPNWNAMNMHGFWT